MFDSERNKQKKRFFCNEIRRISNEILKQLVERIENIVPKAYSLNTHDYKKKTKTNEILMMEIAKQNFLLNKIAKTREHRTHHLSENPISILEN